MSRIKNSINGNPEEYLSYNELNGSYSLKSMPLDSLTLIACLDKMFPERTPNEAELRDVTSLTIRAGRRSLVNMLKNFNRK